MSDFMTPDIHECDYLVIEDQNGDTIIVPDDDFPTELIGRMKAGDRITIECKSGYLYRLSASGFLDCTDWTPAETYQEAIEELLENAATWTDDDEDGERSGPYLEDWANELADELAEIEKGKPVL